MDYYFVTDKGAAYKLCPISLEQFKMMDGVGNFGYNGLDHQEFVKFMEANDYYTLTDFSPQEVANGHIEVRDGKDGLFWSVKTNEWLVEDAPKKNEWLVTPPGFPDDDVFTLGQLASGEANLDFINSSQFVYNEKVNNGVRNITGTAFRFHLEHTPVFKGTMAGTMYYRDEPVLTMCDNSAGYVTYVMVGKQAYSLLAFPSKVNGLTLSHQSGELTLYTDEEVDEKQIRFVISYEYNLEVGDLPTVSHKYRKRSEVPFKNNVAID
jgi:hypothetical protein